MIYIQEPGWLDKEWNAFFLYLKDSQVYGITGPENEIWTRLFYDLQFNILLSYRQNESHLFTRFAFRQQGMKRNHRTMIQFLSSSSDVSYVVYSTVFELRHVLSYINLKVHVAKILIVWHFNEPLLTTFSIRHALLLICCWKTMKKEWREKSL
jgi:hypothetical protein